MAKLKNYKGTAVTPAGFTQKGTGDYALMEAGAIQVDEEGKRLDAELVDIRAEMLTSEALDNYYTKEEIDNVVTDSPYDDGSATNSIIHTNTGANAISENAIAEQGCFAGLKGFIFNDSNSANPSVFNTDGTFTLYATNSDENPVANFFTEHNNEIDTNNYKISFINGSKYINYATVTMSYADPILTITCKDINDDAKNNGTWNAKIKEDRPVDGSALDECTFFFLDLPELGSVDLGINSRASGDNSRALGRGAFAAGRDSIAQSQYSMALGRDCVANYAAVAVNRNTQALGDNSFAGGSGSKVLHNVSYAWGHTLQTGAQYQYVIGKYNDVISDGAFILGNGSSASKRSNALVVDYKGNATFAGKITAAAPTANMHVATKQYVDINTTTWRADTTQIVIGQSANNDKNAQGIGKDGIAIGTGAQIYYGGNVALGPKTKAIHQETVSIGIDNTVNGKYSCAIGVGLRTSETNLCPGDEGYSSSNTTSINKDRNMFVIGRYNKYEGIIGPTISSDTDNKHASMVFGIGSSSTDRRNGMIIYASGRIEGVRNTDKDDDDLTLTTKKYVDDKFASITNANNVAY